MNSPHIIIVDKWVNLLTTGIFCVFAIRFYYIMYTSSNINFLNIGISAVEMWKTQIFRQKNILLLHFPIFSPQFCQQFFGDNFPIVDKAYFFYIFTKTLFFSFLSNPIGKSLYVSDFSMVIRSSISVFRALFLRILSAILSLACITVV